MVAQMAGGFAALLLLMTLALLEQSRSRSRRVLRLPVGLAVIGVVAVVVACGDPSSKSSSTEYSAISADRVHSLWKWCTPCANSDNTTGQWQYYSPDATAQSALADAGYTTFSSVSAGEGFWVRISTSGTPSTMALETPGWSNF